MCLEEPRERLKMEIPILKYLPTLSGFAIIIIVVHGSQRESLKTL